MRRKYSELWQIASQADQKQIEGYTRLIGAYQDERDDTLQKMLEAAGDQNYFDLLKRRLGRLNNEIEDLSDLLTLAKC